MSNTKPDDAPRETEAEKQFKTSSVYHSPPGYPEWVIRNDYPPPKPEDLTPGGPPVGAPDAPWLDVDPFANRIQYMDIIKEYCLEGMIDVDFVPQKNPARQWYHAPWMHLSQDGIGREPIHGLTAERFTPVRELSQTQNRFLQTWGIGFYNTVGASVFGGMWANPNNPDWSKDIKFPKGTLIFKVIYTNGRIDELPMLEGAPTLEALIAVQPDDTTTPDPKVRDDKPQTMRLIQFDFATRDDRAVTGWMWGTFMYTNTSGKTGWDGLIPVGLQWGNDKDLDQAAHRSGQVVKQSWINPKADAVRLSLHGGRPSFGWNGRLCGPADYFASSCASCHSTAEWPKKVDYGQPTPRQLPDGSYEPSIDDKEVMKYWFTNVPCGTPLSEGSRSGDYSLQLYMGYQNYIDWRKKPGKGGDTDTPLPPARGLPRQGPPIEYPNPRV